MFVYRRCCDSYGPPNLSQFAALQQSVEELSQNMQALLQTAHEMLQSIQAFLETSQATAQDAGNAAPHAASDVPTSRSKRRSRRSARRGAGDDIYADFHAREGGGEEATATVVEASKGQKQMM